MLLLLATCYCCIIHHLLWFMYRGVFTVGCTLIGVMDGNNAIITANALTNYSYLNDESDNNVQLTCCATGLGPNDTDDNIAIAGVYFNGNDLLLDVKGDPGFLRGGG